MAPDTPDPTRPMQLLLVERDRQDESRAGRLLAGLHPDTFFLESVAGLEQAREAVGRRDIDAVLLDLDLPGSGGVSTLERAQAFFDLMSIPTVVLTEHGDDALGIEAVRRGAQDFLDKKELTAPLLLRSLRYAIERNRLSRKVDVLNAEADRNEQVQHLLRKAVGEKLAVTAEVFHERSLQEFDSDLFADLVREYSGLLQDSLHEETHRVSDDTAQQKASELAQRLGFLRAGPKDLVDMHLAAFEQLREELPARREKLLQNEGRYVLLALMGHLLSYYRNYCTA